MELRGVSGRCAFITLVAQQELQFSVESCQSEEMWDLHCCHITVILEIVRNPLMHITVFFATRIFLKFLLFIMFFKSKEKHTSRNVNYL